MRLRVLHTTRYTYPSPIRDSQNELRLMPLSDADQTCLDFRLSTTPPARLFSYDLPTGRIHHFNLRAPHDTLAITAEALVVTFRHDPFAGLDLISDESGFYTREGVRQRYIEYLAPTERVPFHPEIDRIAAVARRQAGEGTASFLIALARALHRAFAFAPGSTHVNSTLQHILEHRRGVCQDFTHLMLAVCRRQGIPARYVSGYLYTGERTADNAGKREADEVETGQIVTGRITDEGYPAARAVAAAPSESELVGGDAMHAWVECLLPDEKWHGFDPTNNLLTNDSYIKVHYGRDYGDVPPVRGVYHGPAEHTLEVAVRVTADH